MVEELASVYKLFKELVRCDDCLLKELIECFDRSQVSPMIGNDLVLHGNLKLVCYLAPDL